MLAPALRDRYHLSLGQAGLLISATLLGSVLTLIPWGMAADRVGERIVLVLGIGTCGLALLEAGRVHSFGALFACLFISGLAGASVHSSSGRAVMAWFPVEQRGLALGIRQTAIPIGGFAVSLGLPPIEHVGGVSSGFATLGIACLLSATIAALVLREGSPPDEAVVVAPPPLRDSRVWSLAAGGAGRTQMAGRAAPSPKRTGALATEEGVGGPGTPA